MLYYEDNNPKRAEVATVISDKVDLKRRTNTKNKYRH